MDFKFTGIPLKNSQNLPYNDKYNTLKYPTP